MELKKPLSYTEQVEKLIEHGMSIADKNSAEKFLSKNNYYRFTGYLLQFRESENDSTFLANTIFETACQLYYFDEELRNILKKYIEKLEIYFRTVISHEFSMVKCVNPPHDQHYDENNFYNKEYYNKIMSNFTNQENNYYSDSLIVKHHKRKYGDKLPLWVMVELLSFSDLSKLYSCMYFSEKERIANVVGSNKNRLPNNLHALTVIRNKCAHAARFYNTTINPSIQFTTSFLKKNPEVKNNSVFACILLIEMYLYSAELKSSFFDEISSLVDSYSEYIKLNDIGFPDNWKDILNKHKM